MSTLEARKTAEDAVREGQKIREVNFLKYIFTNEKRIDHYLASRLTGVKGAVTVIGDNDPDDFCLHVYNILRSRRTEPVELVSTHVFAEQARAPAADGHLFIWCPVPQSHDQWTRFHGFKAAIGNSGFLGLWELVSEYAMLDWLYSKTPYYITQPDLAGLYGGTPVPSYSGPVQQVAEAFPLDGKTVIEFGSLDGAQTFSLAMLGAKRVTAVDIRPENAIKVLLGKYIARAENVDVLIANFHSVTGTTAGRFDLAFAHGVYYHSSYPFLFLENLISLSDNILIGGWAATEVKPREDVETLDYEGHSYRVKVHIENEWATAGVEPVSYYFFTDDLIAFYERKGFTAKVLHRVDCATDDGAPAGEFFRILFQRG